MRPHHTPHGTKIDGGHYVFPTQGLHPRTYRDTKKLTKRLIFVGVICGLAGGIASLIAYEFTTPVDAVVPPKLSVMTSASSSRPFTYGQHTLFSDPSFFSTVKKEFQTEAQSFVEADLSAMQIRYYQAGTLTFAAPILSKGKEGSWWETPSGLYQISLKKENHLSSFGNVYQPWSMVFQGNFFIHGWPYHPDGTPVASTYSGGCIRLSDEDAKALYGQVDVGTPVLVHEDDFAGDAFTYTAAPPHIDARAYLVADVGNRTVLAGKHADDVYPIASITKLMTALVAAEYINLDTDVTITRAMIASTSIPRLAAGTTLSAYALFEPLLLESSNSAAHALAATHGEDTFVSYMNRKAGSLGMASTTFVDASGAGAGNVSSARDLFALSTYLVNNRSFVLRISSGEPVPSAYDTHPFSDLHNFNTTPGVTGFVGGKVGKTRAAKETALVLYEMSIAGETRTIAFIVLGSEDRYRAVRRLHAFVRDTWGE